MKDLLVQKESLSILPGPMNKTLPAFKPGQLPEIARALTEMYPVVIGDTPPGILDKAVAGGAVRHR